MPRSFNQPPRIGHLRSASSRNVQRSITWMFQHHLMHQEIRQKALQTKKVSVTVLGRMFKSSVNHQ